MAIVAGVDECLPGERSYRSREDGGRIMVCQILAYHFDIVCDELGPGEDLPVKLLQDIGAFVASDEPGTVDEAGAMGGNGGICGKSKCGENLVHVRLHYIESKNRSKLIQYLRVSGVQTVAGKKAGDV